MWQEVGRQIFGVPTRYFGASGNRQDTPFVSQNNRMHKLDRSTSLPQFPDGTRAYEWYKTLNCSEKDMLENMMSSFTSHGVKIKTAIKIIAQKFNISQQFVRDVIAFWSRGWSRPPQVLKIKSNAQANSVLKLAKWEKMAACKHDYSKEVLIRLLDEEAKQETSWHVVRDDIVELDTFSAHRQVCIEVITKLSYRCRLLPKTIEAAFVYLDRLLVLRGARKILNADSGVKGATGKWSLRAVSICMLMISSKYEEIYPPCLNSFANFAGKTQQQFVELELTLLHAMKWNLITSTSADHIKRYFSAVNSESKTYLLAMFILEASWSVDMSFGYDISIFSPSTSEWLQSGQNKLLPNSVLHVAKPSQIALGCIILSLAYQGKLCYPDSLHHISGISSINFSHIVKHLHMQLRSETEKHVTSNSVVVKKYSTRRYQYIGAFKPPSFRELLEYNSFKGTKLFGNNNHGSPGISSAV